MPIDDARKDALPAAPHGTPRVRPNGLPRSLRIRKSRDFRRLERQALRGASALVTALARPCREDRSRVGFTVSKKVGDAVTRNRVKRLLRETVRQEKNLFEGLELILIARSAAATATFDAMRASVREAVASARSAIAAQRRPRGDGAPQKSPVKRA